MNPPDPSNQPPLDPWAPAPLQAAPVPAPDQAGPAAAPDQAVPAPAPEPLSSNPTTAPQQPGPIPLSEPITEPLPEPILSAAPASQPAEPAAVLARARRARGHPAERANASRRPGDLFAPARGAQRVAAPDMGRPAGDHPRDLVRAAGPRRGRGARRPSAAGPAAGIVFLTAVLAAVLASAGTYAAISASGGLDGRRRPSSARGHERHERDPADHGRRAVGHDQRGGQGRTGRCPDRDRGDRSE